MTLDPTLTYEQALEQLDATLRSLEEGKLSLEEAIAAGATHVRVGTALLGGRPAFVR